MANIDETLGESISKSIEKEEDEVSKQGGVGVSMEDFTTSGVTIIKDEDEESDITKKTDEDEIEIIKNAEDELVGIEYDTLSTTISSTVINDIDLLISDVVLLDTMNTDIDIVQDEVLDNNNDFSTKSKLKLEEENPENPEVNNKEDHNQKVEETKEDEETEEEIEEEIDIVDTTADAGTVTPNDVTADDIINATESGETITLTGTAIGGDISAGDVVSITVNGVTTTGIVDANGNYSVEVAGSNLAADTTANVSVASSDAAGNTVNSTAASTHTVDTIADVGIVTPNDVTADDIINAAESGEIITLTGTAIGGDISEGDSVTMTINGTDYSTTVYEDGTYSVDVAGSDLNKDTNFTVNVSSTDMAGNTIISSADSEHGRGATVSLSATSDITEAGADVEYTATLTNASEGVTTVTLANGETITITDGETTGSTTITVAADEDVYLDESTLTTSIIGATGGNFENLEVDATTVSTTISDTADTTTVTL
ncbi:MAG: Ig-like domain-containing protein, partial [Arcobacteraceae bacterium]|nr:Ig-like domain-containing protein [Arcobacteraceae bacterium]